MQILFHEQAVCGTDTKQKMAYLISMVDIAQGKCYGDITHDIAAWTLLDTINSDWLDKQV